MPVNPFSVQQMGDITPGLAGLGSLLQQRRDVQQQQVTAQRGAELYRTGTPEDIAEFSISNPEIGKRIEQQIGFRDESTKQNFYDTSRKILSDPANTEKYLQERFKFVADIGGDSTMTMQELEHYRRDPEGYGEKVEKAYSMLDPVGYKSYRTAIAPPEEIKDTRTADVKNYEFAKSQGYEGSFLDFQVTGRDTSGKTTAIKEFEYGEKNPKFALSQLKKEDTSATKEAARKEFKDTSDLRKEFLSQSSEFQKVRDSYTRVVGSTQDPSPAGDLSLIFNYMKMLDPGSVVRESEFATAASAGSYGERIQAAAQKVMSGERLTSKMRADFIKKSGTLFKGMQDQHKKREGSYRKIATDNDFNPEEVVIDITAPPEEAQQTPGQPINVTSQSQYDALPSGAVYTEDGVRYRKP